MVMMLMLMMMTIMTMTMMMMLLMMIIMMMMNLSIIIFKSGNGVVHLPPVHKGGSPVGAIIGRQLVIIDGNEKR